MIRSLRAFFLGRLLREKLLLLVFVVFGTLIYLSNFSKRATTFWREQRMTTASLDTQRGFIQRKAEIEAAVQKAAAQLDPSKTYNRTTLVAEVTNLSSAAGFRTTTADPPQTTTNGQFAVNSTTYTIRNVQQADWMALQRFYVSLRDKSPYIGIDQFNLTSPNRTQLNLQLRLSAFEPQANRAAPH